MAESATPPEVSWHHTTCRICMRSFDIVTTDHESEPISLCQTCSILVDWLGQEEYTGSAPNHQHESQNNQQQEQQKKQVNEAKKKGGQQAGLASLLDQWGDLWRRGEE